jgi:hypothetical protein
MSVGEGDVISVIALAGIIGTSLRGSQFRKKKESYDSLAFDGIRSQMAIPRTVKKYRQAFRIARDSPGQRRKNN